MGKYELAAVGKGLKDIKIVYKQLKLDFVNSPTFILISQKLEIHKSILGTYTNFVINIWHTSQNTPSTPILSLNYFLDPNRNISPPSLWKLRILGQF